MSNMLSIMGVLATGLADVAALAFTGTVPAIKKNAESAPLNPLSAIVQRLRRARLGSANNALARLDDHLLRDIGLTRAMLPIARSADFQKQRRYLVD